MEPPNQADEMKYRVKEFRPDHFWITDQNNHPIFDGAPDATDSARVFHDEDLAREHCDRLNAESENDLTQTKAQG